MLGADAVGGAFFVNATHYENQPETVGFLTSCCEFNDPRSVLLAGLKFLMLRFRPFHLIPFILE
jgi:hypothetical protein